MVSLVGVTSLPSSLRLDAKWPLALAINLSISAPSISLASASPYLPRKAVISLDIFLSVMPRSTRSYSSSSCLGVPLCVGFSFGGGVGSGFSSGFFSGVGFSGFFSGVGFTGLAGLAGLAGLPFSPETTFTGLFRSRVTLPVVPSSF